jgi:hypothetical protein
MSNTLAFLELPGGAALLVSPGGVDFFYAPGAEDTQGDNGDGGSSAGGHKRRRWVVRVGKRLVEYATAAEAIAAAEALRDAEIEKAKPKPAASKKPAKKPEAPVEDIPEPEQSVYLDKIKALAKQYDEMAAYQRAMERQQYADVLALFERLQDEEDVEQLLLSIA